MAFYKAEMHCGLLLCVSLALLPAIQGRSTPTGIASEAPAPSFLKGDSWTDARIEVWGWSAPAPFPAPWLPSNSAPLGKSQRATRRLAESTQTLRANVTESPEPAPGKMCIPPPKCKWSNDKDGVANADCTTPSRVPRFLGLCPDSFPFYWFLAFVVVMIWLMLALFRYQVWQWANWAHPGENPHTAMCYFALALGLIVGLYYPMPYSVPLDAASAPGQPNVCIPPPACRWKYDESGEARPDCTAPPHDVPTLVPFLGVICPHQLSTYLVACLGVAVSTIWVASYKVWFVGSAQLLALSVLPRGILEQLRIPWTRACCYAFAWALMVGVACRTRITFETI